jgi:hypothetical protein
MVRRVKSIQETVRRVRSIHGKVGGSGAYREW